MRRDIDVEAYYVHNEYLGVFHDAGMVGVVTLLLAWATVLLSSWRRWEKFAHPLIAKWSMASVLSVSSVLISAITDNTFHYVAVCVPVIIVYSIAITLPITDSGHVGTYSS
jgi:hypothetical protein